MDNHDKYENRNPLGETEMNIDNFSKNSEREETADGMDSNCQESKQEDPKKECTEQKTDESQVPYLEEKEEGTEEQVRFVHHDGTSDGTDHKTDSQDPQGGTKPNAEKVTNGTSEETTQQYSCSYTPPYYVPNFTISDPSTILTEEKPKDKESAKRTKILVGCVILCTLLSMAVGLCGGWLIARFYAKRETSAPGTDSAVTVTKNDGSIVVNEIVGSTGYDNLSVAEVVQLVADSVVEITTSQVQNDIFWGNYVKSGAGSGVVVDPNGYIITNNHVIDGADKVTVRLTSGQEFSATVIGGDADSDIAVLKIEATGLRAAVLGKSTQLKVGQDVVAIGNPLGELGGTVTDGIISALDRQVIVDGYPMTLLQTNAAINPGNSGGGLFNMAGELIGIVNAKQSSSGIEGLGFAIPIDVAWQKASDLMQYGYVTGKIVLDFTVEAKTSEFYLQDGGGFWGKTYTFPAGVYVVTSTNDSLKKYDRITSVNGITVNSISDFYSAIQNLKKGDPLNLVVSRLDTSGVTAHFREHNVPMTVKVTEPTQASGT